MRRGKGNTQGLCLDNRIANGGMDLRVGRREEEFISGKASEIFLLA